LTCPSSGAIILAKVNVGQQFSDKDRECLDYFKTSGGETQTLTSCS
jgi:hypothetical protein